MLLNMNVTVTLDRAREQLREVGLRPTRQRLALARLLFQDCARHITAEGLHAEAAEEGIRVSLATVYNSLHQFVRVGLLREIVVDSGRAYFDTNTSNHHHFFLETEGRLEDIGAEQVALARLPEPPEGTRIGRVDVIIRVQEDNE
jgi:Fur family iron response transcriptional regulator